jgi:hypothetical protein
MTASVAVLIRPLLFKPQYLHGLSERLLVSHYQTNCGGARRRLDALNRTLAELVATGAAPAMGTIARRCRRPRPGSR